MSVGDWARPQGRAHTALPRLFPRRLVSLHTLALLLVIAAVAGLGWLWYRGSPFVKIRQVTVTGLSGPDVGQIRDALRQTALSMTTLNVSMQALEASVQQYGEVESLTVTSHGPHAVTIAVIEQVPVATVQSGGQLQMVDGQGRLLSQSAVAHGVLPEVPLTDAPGTDQITASGALAALKVLRAAPYRFLSHVQSATSSSQHGVILQLRDGPQVYFGATTQLSAKWGALIDVLQASGTAGASYIDVTDPDRPAAGAEVQTSTTAATTTGTTTGTETGSTPASGAA